MHPKLTVPGLKAVCLVLALVFAGHVALSAPPEGAGGKGKSGQSAGHGKGQSQGKGQGASGQGGTQAPGASVSVSISVGDRETVRDYYHTQFKHGSCPPGLAKKNNGCLPPGQAKKLWAIGQPLPPHMVLNDLPPRLLAKLTLPPPGYKYVRAAADILLIATGTSMVVDAVEDLGQL